MHTRRVATFLLGIWLGGSVLLGWITLNTSVHNASVAERLYFHTWEEVQMGLGVALAICLFLGTQKRIAPTIGCCLLILLVLFEHFGLMPGLTNRFYAGVEGAKLLLGGFLTSYLFVFRPKPRARKSVDETVSIRRGPSALHR